jgi:hypothetical protein
LSGTPTTTPPPGATATWLGIDELAARAAVKRELKTQGIEDFPKNDLFGRNALAIHDQLFEGLRIVARVPGDLGQGVLNCLHREWRRAEGVSERRVRPPAGSAAKLADATTVPTDDSAKLLIATPSNSFRLVMRDVPDGVYSNIVIACDLVASDGPCCARSKPSD